MQPSAQSLKLIAFDAEDLAVISAHLQDAVLRVGDMAYLPAQQRFALVANRFNWDQAEADAKRWIKRGYERRRTGVHFDRVTNAKLSKIRQNAPDAVLELLAIQFEEGDAPAGTVTLVFAGGGAVQLSVECVDAQMKDFGGAWETRSKPSHAVDNVPGAC